MSDHVDRVYGAALAQSAGREEAEALVRETYARVLAKPRMLRPDDDVDHLLSVLHGPGEPPVSSPAKASAALRQWVQDERDRTLIRRMVIKRMKLTGVLAGVAAVLGIVVGLL